MRKRQPAPPVQVFCDDCDKEISETPLGRLYGPLVITATIPDFTHAVVQGDYCSRECASRGMNKLVDRLS